MPDLCLDKSLYNPYSVGLTMLLVTALLAGILCGRIRERLVSMIGVALLVFPVFACRLSEPANITNTLGFPSSGTSH